MKVKKILICDGSLDGILTAVYQAYHLRYGHDNIKIIESSENGCAESYELFSEYIDVTTDLEQSKKVATSIMNKISRVAYETVVRACLSGQSGRADIVYRFLILGFHMGPSVMSHLSNDSVNKITALDRHVGREAHHLLGFLRFKEMSQGFLYSVIQPKNNVLTLITPHFEDRLRQENFMIVDSKRGLAAVHHSNMESTYFELSKQELAAIQQMNDSDEDYESLWKTFVQSISIKERENLKLQRNMLPLYFRPFMTEFQEQIK